MAKTETAENEVLLDVKVAEASRLYKFYLNQEKKILGTTSVLVFLAAWEAMSASTPLGAFLYTWGLAPLFDFFLRWLFNGAVGILNGAIWGLNLVGMEIASLPFKGPAQPINPMFISAPSLVANAAYQAFASADREIWNDLRVSGIEFLAGYGLSVAFAIPFGIMVGWYKRASYIFDPFINAMNATPRVALLPIIIIWVGIGLMSKVVLVFLGAIFPILINTRDGVKTTPYNLLTAGRSFGASQWQIFKTIVLPSTVPFILTGLRLGVGRALIGVVVGELYAATAGVGFMLTVAGATFQTDKVFFGILIFATSGMVAMELLTKLEKRFDTWRPKVGAAAEVDPF